MHLLDADAWTWSQPQLAKLRPPPLSCHTCTPLDGSLLLFGGMSQTLDDGGDVALAYSSDVWTLDCLTMEWERLRQRGAAPKAVAYHAAPITPDGQLLVLGGWRGEVAPSDSLAALDLTTGAWHHLGVHGETPAGMYGHRAVVVGGKVVVFGGWDSINPMNLVHVLDTGELPRRAALLRGSAVARRSAVPARRGVAQGAVGSRGGRGRNERRARRVTGCASI